MKTKEDVFKELIDGYKITISSDTKFNVIDYYNKKGKRLISYHLNDENMEIESYAWISYIEIWSTFEINHKMSKNRLKTFMKKMLLKHLNLNNIEII